MYQSKVLVVLDMHLICTTFLNVEFGAENQIRIKNALEHLTCHFLTKVWFKLFLFLQK